MPRIPRLGRSGAPQIREPTERQAPAGARNPLEPESAPAHTGGAQDGSDTAKLEPQTDSVADLAPGTAGLAGYAQRGRLRRRLRFLRRARELAFRDLGGLVFDLHRFGRQREDLVAAKLGTLTRIDHELRALETALEDQRSVTVLREPGIAACPHCAAIHGSDARFCPNCGLRVRDQVATQASEAGPTSGDAGRDPSSPGAIENGGASQDEADGKEKGSEVTAPAPAPGSDANGSPSA